jgi:hypothetical protein
MRGHTRYLSCALCAHTNVRDVEAGDLARNWNPGVHVRMRMLFDSR